MDSPTKKKQYGTGTCWEYMERGTCDCPSTGGKYPRSLWTHPKLAVSEWTHEESRSSTIVAVLPRHIPEWLDRLSTLGWVEGDPTGDAILDCKFEERDEVKKLGAIWKPEIHKWCVPAGRPLTPFSKWHPIVRGRVIGEKIFHNPNIDMEMAMSRLRSFGFFPGQIVSQRGSAEVERILDETILTSTQKSSMGDDGKNAEGSNLSGSKRRLDFPNDRDGGTEGRDDADNVSITDNQSTLNKRPCMSTPDSKNGNVGTQQSENEEQREEAIPARGNESDGDSLANEIDQSLLAVKCALARCRRSQETSEDEQQLYESMYEVLEKIGQNQIKLSKSLNELTRKLHS